MTHPINLTGEDTKVPHCDKGYELVRTPECSCVKTKKKIQKFSRLHTEVSNKTKVNKLSNPKEYKPGKEINEKGIRVLKKNFNKKTKKKIQDPSHLHHKLSNKHKTKVNKLSVSKPCKPGKKRNENGRCVLIKNLNKKTKKKIQDPSHLHHKLSNKHKTKVNKLSVSKPCKPGKERNENGRCVLIKNLNKKNIKKVNIHPPSPENLSSPTNIFLTNKNILIKDKSTSGQKAIKEQISTMIYDGILNSVDEISRINATNKQMENINLLKNSIKTIQKSFSPEINKEFISNLDDRANIFECSNSFEELISKFKISVGKRKNGNPICKPVSSQEAKDVLLKNLNNNKIDQEQIIAPVQNRSNCWFNALFVCFFFSDKGRKFFKFFRRLMILGTHSNGVKMSSKMSKGFMLWNLCIEASYGNKDLALSMNTNKVIKQIYDSLKVKDKKNLRIRKVGQAGNPVDYYSDLLKILNNNEMPFLYPNVSVSRELLLKKRRLGEGTQSISDPPNVLFLHFHGLKDVSNSNIDFLNIEVLSKNDESIKYVLDAVTVRDIDKKHFCALITVNGKELGFDGASFSRLNPFEWRDLLKDKKKWSVNWEFEGSVFKGGTLHGKQIQWNFEESYLILKYYRI